MAAPDPARDDPFFAELRRKHPDVDIVLLPPVDTTPPVEPPATIGQATATQRHTTAVLAALWTRVGRTPTASVGLWWQQANPHLHRYVANGAVSGLKENETEPLVNEIARALLDLGWRPQPSPADQPSLMARVGTIDLKVTGNATSVSVEAVSDALHLTPDTLSRLAANS
ncbi:hypothetical protein [Nocardioides sp. InS609-2]|uniref:hypothetical protein n=1 Tax=Nocardioides sp. InS609-2 TaxID=2760705 RepID=UPI001826D6D3|nr:hypothetical protein [Nocardioides sp. InS609-2]MBA3781767.1 hypothetical protein [Nocardioides sp.]